MKALITFLSVFVIINAVHAQQRAIIQEPKRVDFVSSAGTGGTVDYNFTLMDKSSPANPMKSVPVQIFEYLGARTLIWRDGTGAVYYQKIEQAQPYNQAFSGATSSSGGWNDHITMGPASVVLLRAALAASDVHSSTLENSSYDHNYVSAIYLGTTYTFDPPCNQKKSFTFTCTLTPKPGGGNTLSYGTTGILP